MTITRFFDLNQAPMLDYKYIYIELPESLARRYFVHKFFPDIIDSEDYLDQFYQITEEPNLKCGSAYERGCAFALDHWIERPFEFVFNDGSKQYKTYYSLDDWVKMGNVLVIDYGSL